MPKQQEEPEKSVDALKFESDVLTTPIPYLRKAFGFRGVGRYDVNRHQIMMENGRPLGHRFIYRIVKNPSSAYSMVKTAREIYARKLDEFNTIRQKAEVGRVPFEKAVEDLVRWWMESQGGALDNIFDGETYGKALKRQLEPSKAEKLTDKIILSQLPRTGINVNYSFNHHALLHLANKQRKSSSHPSTDHYRDFTWRWYRENYISPKGRMNNFFTSEAEQKEELSRFMRIHGLDRLDFRGVRSKLADLQGVRRSLRYLRSNAADALLKNARSRQARKIIDALTYFAAETFNISEEMHLSDRRFANVVKLAAEKRGISQERQMDIVLSTFAKFVKAQKENAA